MLAAQGIISRDDARAVRDALDALGSCDLNTVKYDGTDEARATMLSPRHFVNVRRTRGGPAPEETARASRASHEELENDRAWWKKATGALTSAERLLAERSAAL